MHEFTTSQPLSGNVNCAIDCIEQCCNCLYFGWSFLLLVEAANVLLDCPVAPGLYGHLHDHITPVRGHIAPFSTHYSH